MARKTLTQASQKPQLKAEGIAKQIFSEVQGSKFRDEAKATMLFLGLVAAATAGRIALQFVPSVEPIIPFAVLAGLLFGAREGFALGGSAYIMSNFFIWGLQGPWTIFQALGAGLAGMIAGFAGKAKKPTWVDLVVLSVLGTVFFEAIMNISGAFMGIGAGVFGLGLLAIPLYFLTSLPFSLVHIISNVAFALALKPLLKWRKNHGFKAISFSRTNAGTTTSVRLYKSDD